MWWNIPDNRTAGIVVFFFGIIILFLRFSSLAAGPLLLMLNSIFYSLKVWIQVFGAAEITVT